MNLTAWVDARGGFVTATQLRKRGVTRTELERALALGGLRRVRRGHFSTIQPRDPRFIAVRIGGRLTGTSAIQALGGWVWDPPIRPQIAVAPGASRLRLKSTDDVDLYWKSDDERGGSAAVVGARSALVRVALDEPLENAVPCFDWALHTGVLDRIQFEQVLLRLPKSAAVIREWVDENAQSVLEGIPRVRCRQKGWHVRSQVGVRDLEAIDLVVEELVALELDGREFHESTFDADRLKDLWITIEGRHSIRASTNVVRNQWPEIELAIESALLARRAGNCNSAAVPPTPRGTRRHRLTDDGSG